MELKPIKKKDLDKIFKTILLDRLKSYGFKKKDYYLRKDDHEFFLDISYSVADYGLKWVDYNFNYGSYSLANLASYCSGEMENIFNKLYIPFYGISSAYLEKETDSMKHFEIWNEEQAIEGANKMADYFINHFYPETQKYKTWEEINYLLNESSYHDIALKWKNIEYFFMRCLILAKIISENYYQTKIRYQESYFNKIGWDGVSHWHKTIETLDKYSITEIQAKIDQLLEDNQNKKPEKKSKEPIPIPENSDSDQFTGFDQDGEPEIIEESDGSMTIIFNFMPPLNGHEEQSKNEIFDEFDSYLSKELGVKVVQDDREVFIIEKPQPDTKDKLIELLKDFWNHHEF